MIDGSQALTGVTPEAGLWGEAFQPLEHHLDERRGRRLDTDQIQAYQSAIHVVRECIRLAPALDAVLADRLAFGEPEKGADSWRSARRRPTSPS